MPIAADILQRAIRVYLEIAYGGKAAPETARARAEPILGLKAGEVVPEGMLEKDAANSMPSFALRLGQPLYPFMKLVVEPAPCAAGAAAGARGYLLRVDSHDRHLHAAEGSADAAWLQSVRTSNKELSEKIEGAWSQAGLPTFKDFLRRQLEERRAKRGAT